MSTNRDTLELHATEKAPAIPVRKRLPSKPRGPAKWDPKLIVAVIGAVAAVAAAAVNSSAAWFKVDAPVVTGAAPATRASEVDLDVATMIESLNRDEFAAAMRLADRVLQADPDNYRAYNTKGSVAFYRGEFQEAARCFEKAHVLRPDVIGYTSNLADAYVELGWVDRAIQLYDSIRTASTEWWYAEGRAYLLAGRYREAADLLSLVPTNYNRGTARIVRAAALAGLTDIEGSRAEFKVGLAQDPDYWRDVLAGVRLEKRESYTKVARLLEEHHVSKS